jgi:flagellin
MSQIQDLLLRMKELAVSSASDTFGDNDRTAANTELQTLSTAINDIAARTRYSGKVLLDGSAGQLDIQTGEDSADLTSFTPANVQSSALSVDGLDISSKSGAVSAQATIDAAITTLASARSDVGAFMVGLESTISVNQLKSENLDAAISVFAEADLAKEATNLAMADIKSQMAQAMITKENQAAANITGLVR